eukprot:gene7188-8913_t
MGRSLPDKRSAANPIRQPVPLSGQAEPDHQLALAPSRNRPALGASSNEGGRDSGTQSNRAGWPGRFGRGSAPFHVDARRIEGVGHRLGGTPKRIARKSRNRRFRPKLAIPRGLHTIFSSCLGGLADL